MPEDLRKNIGKSLVETKQQAEDARRRLAAYAEHDRIKTERNWNQCWIDFREAIAKGYRTPERRSWLIIDPDTPVPTARKLQELAGMAALPRVIETRYTGLLGDDDIDKFVPMKDGKPKNVQAGNLSAMEYKEIQAKTEYERHIFVWEDKNSCEGATLMTSILNVRRNNAAG
ncbi:unnamed protein product [Discula destructiva]